MASSIVAQDRLATFVERFRQEGWADVGPAWLRELRTQAMDQAIKQGPPNRHTPGWEHTTTKPIWVPRKRPNPGQLDPAVLERSAFQDEAARLVLVDGHFDARLSRLDGLPKGLIVAPLDQVWGDDAFRTSQESRLPGMDTLGLLNMAFLQDGAFIHIPSGMQVDHPLHVVDVHTRPGTMTSTKHVILAGKGAKADIVESWVGSAPDTLSLHTTELVATDGAHIAHVKQQLEHVEAVHMAGIQATVARDARVDTFLWSDGGKWSRSGTDVRLIAPGASCSVDGLWLGRAGQMHDCPTRIEHAAPHTTSHELWKGIMDDESHGIFLGNVIVQPGAQKVDSKQTNRNLLLSRKARVDTTPQLEIHADDVKCAHGSTIGRLDPDALFFLRARGIGRQRAELLLTKAFAGEVLGRLGSWGIRTRLERRLENWFTRRGK